MKYIDSTIDDRPSYGGYVPDDQSRVTDTGAVLNMPDLDADELQALENYIDHQESGLIAVQFSTS